MSFQQQLKSQRTLRGWSQARLAEELHTTPNTVSTWERGIALPSPYFREKLCILFNMNARELALLPAHDETSNLAQKILQPSIFPAAPAALSEELNAEASLQNDMLCAEKERPKELESGQQTTDVLLTPAKTRRWRSRRHVMVSICSILLAAGGLWLALFSGFLVFNPYTHLHRRLVLNDSLQQQNSESNWQEGWNTNRASCEFKNGMYYARQPLQGYFHACLAQKTDFSNFTYEVEMTIESGDYGGLIFRATNSKDDKYYLFRIDIHGTYALQQYVDSVSDHALTLIQGQISIFNSHSQQRNLLAVVAQDTLLKLYLNRQEIASVHDTHYSHGQIGLFGGNDTRTPAQVTFTNARIWV
jgi:transcriptional regulator with XRE-family HTH domain